VENTFLIPDDVHHVLCALHKKTNFSKKLNHYGQIKETRKTIMKLFETVCYHDHRAIAEHALVDIEQHGLTKLNKYIDNHVKPELPQFSRSHLSSHFCAGFTMSSCAESCNRMLKRGMRNAEYSLTECRKYFDIRTENRRLIIQSKHVKERPTLSPWEEQFSVQVASPMRARLENALTSSIDCEVRQTVLDSTK
jgi:hypothetical protein